MGSCLPSVEDDGSTLNVARPPDMPADENYRKRNASGSDEGATSNKGQKKR